MNARLWKDRHCFVGGSGVLVIIGDGEAALLRPWRKKRREFEPTDLSGNLTTQLTLTPNDLNRRWYQTISGRMLAGPYILTVFYATAVILLARLPWNVLLLLLLLPSRYKRLRETRPGSPL